MNCQMCVTQNWNSRTDSYQFCFIYIGLVTNILLICLLLFIPDISSHFMYTASIMYENISILTLKSESSWPKLAT